MSTEEKKTINTGDSTGDEVYENSLQKPDMIPTPVLQSADLMQDLTDAELEAVIGGASTASSEISVSVNGTGDVVNTNPGNSTPLSQA
jgi:hypothetical protein